MIILFITFWLAVCPVCGNVFTQTVQDADEWKHPPAQVTAYELERNLLECPKCHAAVFAQIEKVGKYTPTENGMNEEIIYYNGYINETTEKRTEAIVEE